MWNLLPGAGGGGGKGDSRKLYTGGPPPEVQPLPFTHQFLTGKVALCIPSIDKWYPFHIPSVRAEPR